MSETATETNGDAITAAPKPFLMKLKKLKPTAAAAIPASSSSQKKATTFVCAVCRAQFSTPSSLKDHFKQHAKNPIDTPSSPSSAQEKPTVPVNPTSTTSIAGPIPCDFCPLILPNISKAIQHKYRKHRFEGKNNFCEFCGRLFPLRVALEQHKETNHSAEIQSKKSSAQATTVAATASGELPTNETETTPTTTDPDANLTCKFCSAPFLSLSALDFHENGVHKFEQNLLKPIFMPPPSTKIKMNNNSEVFSVYYCYLCGTEYIMKYNLKKHLQDHHTQPERNMPPQDGLIRCKTCEAIFYSTKAYEAHAIHHRPDDLYVTSEEHRRQVVHRVDQDFDFRRVPQNSIAMPKMKRRPRKPLDTGSVSRPTKAAKISDDESMSPPSSASNSSDEEEEKAVEEKNTSYGS